jgi:hypothetical protein
MLTGKLVQRARLFYPSKTIFVGLLPLSDEPSEWLHFVHVRPKLKYWLFTVSSPTQTNPRDSKDFIAV